MMESILSELVAMTGPSGFEQDVARWIYDRLAKVADEIHVDGAGNVIARKRGKHPGPRLLVAAHMDEVGFVVKKIEDTGLIRFETLGGHDNRVLVAQRVRIRTQTGHRTGVIATHSMHMNRVDDVSRVRSHRELYIDVGATSREDVRDLGIEVGDPVSFATALERMGTSRMVGKSFDDRAGCAVLITAFENLDVDQLHGELIAAFTVQEEIGIRGAEIVAGYVDADVALAIDTTAVSDTPEGMMDQTLGLGRGPCIKVMDFSLVASVSVRRALVRVADEAGIPYQLEVFTGIGTDAGALFRARRGVPSGVISIPSRGAHSPLEVIDWNDLVGCLNLLTQFILSLRPDSDFRFIPV